jgi:hypothetical protein
MSGSGYFRLLKVAHYRMSDRLIAPTRCTLADKSSCLDTAEPDFDFGALAMLGRLASVRRVLALGLFTNRLPSTW